MTQEAIKTEVYHKSVHAGYTVVAKELNERFPDNGLLVTRRQVYTWSTRRDRNGFPRSYPVLAPSGKIKNLYHLNDVIDWYKSYVPKRGGRGRSIAVDNRVSSE